MIMASSLLYAILAYERFHGNALLSDSGGNLYPTAQLQVILNLNLTTFIG